jgi:hypothetical protein
MIVAASFAAPLAAQSVDEDVRCLLASNVFARGEKDPGKKQLAMAASVFYLGRLDARISTMQLKTAVAAQSKTMTAASLGPTMTACAKRLRDKGVALQAAGGRAPVPPPAPAKAK